MTDTSTPDRPVSDVDPFSRPFLENPYPYHETLREVGPMVWLEQYGIWATARYEPVHAILSDWQTFCSSRGVGLSDFAKEKPWRPPSLILEADPPLHTRTRGVLTRIMSPAAIRKLRDKFQEDADKLIDPLLEKGSFDAVKELTEKYPAKVFPDAVGLPDERRENLLIYGSMAFNAFGPRNWLFEEAMENAKPVGEWIVSMCRREALSPDGFGAQIYAAADAGEITEEEAPLLVRSLLTAGVDTTVNGLGYAVMCMAQNPDQWQLLREDPKLARPAFEEVLRWASPVQTFFRTSTREVEVAGVQIGEGEKVLTFLAGANRDPRQWENPNKFDIKRRATGHTAFGTGIHGCVGQAVARLEAEIVLTTLAKKIKSIELTGEPVIRLNNTLRGVASLPIRVQPV
jgi:cytochrome P450